MEEMTAVAYRDNDGYMRLIRRFPLVPIRSDKQLKLALEIIDELLDRKHLSTDERDYFNILVDQVKHFEDKQYPLPDVPPAQLLKYLLQRNGLKPADLATLLGSKSVVSEVLSGKRELSKAHIARLSARFAVSPAAFFPPV